VNRTLGPIQFYRIWADHVRLLRPDLAMRLQVRTTSEDGTLP
jgi:hypothetical protein